MKGRFILKRFICDVLYILKNFQVFSKNYGPSERSPCFFPFTFIFTQLFSCSVVPSYHLPLKGEDMIFLETCKNLRHQNHCIIECVPVPKEIGDMAPIYFKACLHFLKLVCWKERFLILYRLLHVLCAILVTKVGCRVAHV